MAGVADALSDVNSRLGDVRSGSVKRVASAVGEGSVVVQAIHQSRSLREARLPEAMSLRTCDRWAKEYLANNPASPIDGVYLYQLTVVEQPNDQSVISHALRISETARFGTWRSPPGNQRRGFALNLAVGVGTEPTRVKLVGGPAPQFMEEAYHYQKGEFYTLHVVDPNKPTNAWIRNLASGIFQYAVFQSGDSQMTWGGHFPPVKDITLFD